MQSQATSVTAYLESLAPDRRAAIEAVRAMILANVDENIEEGMQYGMLGYYVPHRVFPQGYHCDPRQPLPYISLGSKKNHLSMHMMAVYGDAGTEQLLRDGFAKAGKKLDMGKACIRFKRLEDLDLDALAAVIRRVSAAKYIERYVQLVGPDGWKRAARKQSAPKQASTPEKKSAPKKSRPK